MAGMTVGEFKTLLGGMSTALKSLSDRLGAEEASAVVSDLLTEPGQFCTSRFSSNCKAPVDDALRVGDLVDAMTDIVTWMGDVDGLFKDVDDDLPLISKSREARLGDR
jgi:hypothetical protein